ncbi:MAG: hypothetical protein L6R35_006906 [Caloplaca aegaea]|nr:MAG: hypothetical protein L6R35_006906 [Caloplaca aegaea]
MNTDVTLLGTGIGLPEGPHTGTIGGRHIAVDPWQPTRVTWDQALHIDQTAQVMYDAGSVPFALHLMARCLVLPPMPQYSTMQMV